MNRGALTHPSGTPLHEGASYDAAGAAPGAPAARGAPLPGDGAACALPVAGTVSVGLGSDALGAVDDAAAAFAAS